MAKKVQASRESGLGKSLSRKTELGAGGKKMSDRTRIKIGEKLKRDLDLGSNSRFWCLEQDYQIIKFDDLRCLFANSLSEAFLKSFHLFFGQYKEF